MSGSSVGLQEFVPTDEWPDVSVMLEGFGAPSLPDSDGLAGKTIDIAFEDDTTIRYEFIDARRLAVRDAARSDAGENGAHAYRAVEVRPSIFYIDYLTGAGVKTHDVSLVVNLHDGKVTVADTGFVSRDGAIRTQTEFRSGRVRGSGPVEPRPRTDALVGKRIYYRYSETEAYEHVYLNRGTVAWQCVRGGEQGLADVEQMMAFELADDIVIYFWTETVMPVDSFLVVDLAYRRSIGRMFCWDAPALEVVHLPFDSRLTVLNETVYPDDDGELPRETAKEQAR